MWEGMLSIPDLFVLLFFTLSVIPFKMTKWIQTKQRIGFFFRFGQRSKIVSLTLTKGGML